MGAHLLEIVDAPSGYPKWNGRGRVREGKSKMQIEVVPREVSFSRESDSNVRRACVNLK